MVPMFEACLRFEPPRPRWQWHEPREDKDKISIVGETVQVIVKAATYVLKPGETDYKGSWHVEGMSHERIIASGIYYYHTSDNIKGEGLMFRRRLTGHESESIDMDGNGGGGATHEMGTVPTPSGSCLVFHNQCKQSLFFMIPFFVLCQRIPIM
jgi:hypothetical protein